MSAAATGSRHLAGRAAFAARPAGALFVLLALASVAAAVPSRYAQLLAVSPIANTAAGQLGPEDAQRLIQSGLTPRAYATYFTAVEILGALVALGVAGLIVASHSHHGMAWLVSLNLVAAAASLPLVPALGAAHPQWAWLVVAWQAVFAGSLIPVCCLFPDGRFVPRWTRWLTVAWLVYTGLWLIYLPWQPPTSFGRGLAAKDAGPIILEVIFLLAGALVQIWRYRRVSGPLERQRTRWVVFGFSILLVCFVAGVSTLTYVSAAAVGLSYVAARLAGPTFILVGFLALTGSIAFSLLRYRLWDIDILIRRTLIYSTLTLLLALSYFVSVIVLQNIFSALTGQGQGQSTLVTVLSTLVIAALFVPLRRRVQAVIDRRLYRRKYDAALMVTQFAVAVRDEVELAALTEHLLGVVDDTMQPDGIMLWLKSP